MLLNLCNNALNSSKHSFKVLFNWSVAGYPNLEPQTNKSLEQAWSTPAFACFKYFSSFEALFSSGARNFKASKGWSILWYL